MASKRRVRQRACQSKIAYPTREAAFARMSWLLRRKEERGLHVYACTFGQHFHVGHWPGTAYTAVAMKREANAR